MIGIDLKGRRALVTGSGSGTGAATAPGSGAGTALARAGGAASRKLGFYWGHCYIRAFGFFPSLIFDLRRRMER